MTQAFNLSQFANKVNTSGQADLATAVTGTLPVANGGTNNGSLAVTAGGALYTDGTKVVNVGAGTSGQLLQSNGASAPSWATLSTESMTLLGTMTFSASTSYSLTSLDLTPYKFLVVSCEIQSNSASNGPFALNNNNTFVSNTLNNQFIFATSRYDATAMAGGAWVDLNNGFGFGALKRAAGQVSSGRTGIVNATTTVYINSNAGAISGGSARFYGVK